MILAEIQEDILSRSSTMATKVQPHSPTPVVTSLKYAPNVVETSIVEIPQREKLPIAVVYITGQEAIVESFAEVLGLQWLSASTLVYEQEPEEALLLGISQQDAMKSLDRRDKERIILINTHFVDGGSTPDESISSSADYEFLYTHTPLFRRDLTRFLSFVLGQNNHHDELIRKSRTTFISTTFPDVRTALPNLDILSVGSDAVELRVDLLKEPQSGGTFSKVPSLRYVGEQVMLLRQRTELPIIFTTRCTKENGKFPMEDPYLFYEYLCKAIQWGVEYIDVELWLPEEIRKKIAERKGNSKIISAFHDFSGTWKWPSPEAQTRFSEGARYADIVKMIAMINTMDENYQLEYFRSTIKSKFAHTPLSAVNMGSMGKLSRALNTVFSPITHPLLPTIAAPGQLSAAEINGHLHIMGQLPKREIYAIGSFRPTPQSVFFEKCFNELGLPHNISCVDRGSKSSIEQLISQPTFGGAYINPPVSAASGYVSTLTTAASSIGLIDTIALRNHDGGRALVGDNATWKGIRATLTRDYVPSAYSGRPAIILAGSESDAAPTIFALRSLNIGTIYTVGFRARGPLAAGLEPFTSVDSVKRVELPFVIISALPSEKSPLVQPLLRHYSANGRVSPRSKGRVYLDLATGPRKGDPLAAATAIGWTAYGSSDVSTWSIVETLRLLVGHNVPFDFVRMASGRGLY